MYTWSFAYNIDAIREWLFAQKKGFNHKNCGMNNPYV